MKKRDFFQNSIYLIIFLCSMLGLVIYGIFFEPTKETPPSSPHFSLSDEEKWQIEQSLNELNERRSEFPHGRDR